MEAGILAASLAFNVRAYGATGNGSTDDTTAMNTAITAAKAASGTLKIPAGTYLVSSPLLVGGGSPGALKIEGDGWGSQIKLANASNCYIFDFGSSGSAQYTPGLVMRDLYLNCNGINQSATSGGIFGHGACFCLFDHLWVGTPFYAGIYLYQDGLGGYGHHNTVRNCLIDSSLGTISGQYGVRMEQSDENVITGNIIQGVGNPATASYPTGIVDVAGLQTICDNQLVTGTGIYSGSAGGNTRIVNNICDGSYSAAGQIYCGSPHCIVANNFCYNIGYNQTTNTGDGILLDNTDHLTVTGNMCFPYASTVAHSGINLSGTVTSSIVEGNTIQATGGGSFTYTVKTGALSGGTRICNNQGYNPVGLIGSPPGVPASTGSVTNNTGTDCVVYITAGSGVTVSAILIGGSAAGPQAIAASTTAPGISLPAGQTISLTYAGGTPTWTWFGN